MARRLTIRAVNAALLKNGLRVEIVGGSGYFYFMPLDTRAGWVNEVPSVYVPRLNDLSLDEWVSHVLEFARAAVGTC